TALRLPKLPAKLYRFNITTYCRQVAPITFPETLSMLHVNVVGGAFDPSFLLPEQLQELVLQSQSDDEVALPRLPRSLRKLTIQGGVRLRATADLSALLSLRVALRTPPVALPILPRGL